MEPGSSLPGGVVAVGRAEVDVVVEARAWRAALPRVEALARRALAATLADQGASGHLTLLLSDDAAVRRLNAGFRGREKPTNVLSFPAPEGSGTLGDLALAYGVVRREAAEAGRPMAAHLAHLLVHGALHLLGHDHAAAGEAMAMERAEARILRRIGVANPWRARWREAA